MNPFIQRAAALTVLFILSGCASKGSEEQTADLSTYTKPVLNAAKAAGRGVYRTFDEGSKLVIKGLKATRDTIPENIRTTTTKTASTASNLAVDGALYSLSLLPVDAQKLLPQEIEQAIPAPSVPERAAVPEIPAEADALIFIMRPHFTGVFNRFEIYLNGREPENLAGYTRHYEYIALPVKAGRYSLHSKGENWSTVNVTINPGERIFLEQKASKGLLLSNQKLVQITPQKASEYLVFTEPGSLVLAGQDVPGLSYMDEVSHLADYTTRRSRKQIAETRKTVQKLYTQVIGEDSP